MDRALYLATSGANQDMQALRLHANNLANANTTGFRADLQQARSIQAYGEGLPTRVFAMTERPGSDYTQGSVVTTGRDLDVTIAGEGWLAVLDSKGQESYTRRGDLKIDPTGLLQTGSGHLLVGEGGAPLILPLPISKVEVGHDGTVSVLPQGAPADAMEEIGRIKLVNPERTELYKDSDGLFKTHNQDFVAAADIGVSLAAGAVEGSNVNAVNEMTNLIDLQRHFEMQVKIMKTAEEMDRSAASLLRMA